MQTASKIPCNQDEFDVAARRYCALLAAAAQLQSTHGTFYTACLLAENAVKIEHAMLVLGLRKASTASSAAGMRECKP